MNTPTKVKIATVAGVDPNVKFNVVIVPAGAAYGREDCLVNDYGAPLVEFYDVRFPHTEHGQFVSRYTLDTFQGHHGGLCLDGGIKAWAVSCAGMDHARGAVAAWVAGRTG